MSQVIENQQVKEESLTNTQQSHVDMILGLKENSGLEYLPGGQSITMLKGRFEFQKHIVEIVKCQWTKTQKGYAIRVNNYYAHKNHKLQIGLDTLKQCLAVIETLKIEGVATLWTNHTITTGEFVK